MEGTRQIQVNNDFGQNLSSIKPKIQNRQRRKTKVVKRSYAKFKTKIIAVNLVLSLIFVIMISGNNTEMVNISSNNSVLEQANRDLYVQLNSLESMNLDMNSKNRIEQVAQSRLDMVYPSSDNIVELEISSQEKLVDFSEESIHASDIDDKKSIISAITDIFR